MWEGSGHRGEGPVLATAGSSREVVLFLPAAMKRGSGGLRAIKVPEDIIIPEPTRQVSETLRGTTDLHIPRLAGAQTVMVAEP